MELSVTRGWESMYRSSVLKLLSGARDRATEEKKILTVSQSQGIHSTLLVLRHGNRVNKDYRTPTNTMEQDISSSAVLVH